MILRQNNCVIILPKNYSAYSLGQHKTQKFFLTFAAQWLGRDDHFRRDLDLAFTFAFAPFFFNGEGFLSSPEKISATLTLNPGKISGQARVLDSHRRPVGDMTTTLFSKEKRSAGRKPRLSDWRRRRGPWVGAVGAAASISLSIAVAMMIYLVKNVRNNCQLIKQTHKSGKKFVHLYASP
jgi:hypothetical protein